MKKYLAFGKVYFKDQISSIFDFVGPIISYIIHILVLEQLFEFIFANKITDGFSKKDLVWYVIFAEVFMYSFHYAYRLIAKDIQNGNIAYSLCKPYNFMLRIISEQLSTLPRTCMYAIIGIILGTILVGPINILWYNIPLVILIFILSLLILLLINLIVGMLALWLGNDVSSVWLITSKFMLILIFTPLDFFPKIVQKIAKFLPTTHITYTPSELLVHFSYTSFAEALIYDLVSLTVLSIICYIIYRKGVKKLNVTGI